MSAALVTSNLAGFPKMMHAGSFAELFRSVRRNLSCGLPSHAFAALTALCGVPPHDLSVSNIFNNLPVYETEVYFFIKPIT